MTPPLTLNLFGGVSLWHDGVALATPKSRKGLALFLYLACTGRAHEREALADLLWDATSTRQSLSNLRTVLSRLPAPLAAHLLIDRATVAVDPAGSRLVDALELERVVKTATAALNAQSATQLATALASYQGKFLDGFSVEDATRFTEWLVVERERLRYLALDGYQQLTTYYLVSGDYEAGIEVATALLRLDPTDETGHAHLIRLLAYSGQRAAALVQFDAYRRLLQAEFGVEPDAALQALYRQIRDDTLTAPHPVAAEAPIPRHNLPAQLTALLGRQTAITAVQALLRRPEVRLVTLTGPGGVGKSRLGEAVAWSLLTDFADGVFLIELAAVRDPHLVISTIAQTLDVRDQGSTPLPARLQEYLQEKQLLLLIDNFEQVIDAAPRLLQLLRACPQVKILVTSRETLRLRGEQEFPVPILAPADAVELFAQRAQAVQPTFTLNERTTEIVTTICQQLDYLPLAIELAAAQSKLFAPSAIRARLQDRFAFLVGRTRDLPDRQRTLRATLDWSYDLLTAEEKRLFRGLAVFRGGFTREAAQAVTGLSLRDLHLFVNKSLLQINQTYDRYEMHELLYQYAQEKLADDPAWRHRLSARHSYYYCQWVQHQEVAIKGADTAYALRKIDCEFDNLNAAWLWSLEERNVELLYNTAKIFCIYYLVRSRDTAGYAIVERSLTMLQSQALADEQGTALSEQLVIKLTICLARFALRMGRLPQAGQAITAVLQQVMQSPDRHTMQSLQAEALLVHGHILYSTHLVGAYHAYSEAEALFQTIGDTWNRANALMALGATAQDLGQLVQASQYYEACVALRRQLDGPRALGEALLRLADHRQEQLLLREAQMLVEEALAIFRRLDDLRWQAHSYGQRGFLALYRCDYAACIRDCDRAVALLTQLDREHEAIHWLYHAATAHFCQDNDVQVVQYLARCQGVAQRFADTFWEALCTFLTGCRLLSKGDYPAALFTLQSTEAQLFDRSEVSYVWAIASYVHWQLADYAAARQAVTQALAAAIAHTSIRTLALALPMAALLLQQQTGDAPRAAMIYRLAETLPYVGNSPFFMRIIGQRLLPAAAVSPYQREVLSDPWLTARAIYQQLLMEQ